MSAKRAPGRMVAALILFCTCIYLWTAPGRIQFPDDEIVYQTTAAMYERRSLAIAGISKPTGEPKGRPPGTFGWEYGKDGQRYGFFGHGLSVVALPAYALGHATYDVVPHTWRHAVRSDHYFFHPRSPHADWTRLVVSLTNCMVTGCAVGVCALWLLWLGCRRKPAIATALLYGLGSTAWPYTRTFLSEPLSGLVLLSIAAAITLFHRQRTQGRDAVAPLWVAGALAGFSVHVHILNLAALPPLMAYAMVPLWRSGELRETRRAWLGGCLLGTVLLGLWLWGQYWRFGNPFETGRMGYYSHTVAPFEAMAAQLVAPGRSLFVYAPVVGLGLWGLRRAWRQVPGAVWMALCVAGLRYLMISTRSDWWGGWAIGPRHLIPVLGFLLLPLAFALTDLRQHFVAKPLRTAIWVAGLLGSVALSGYLACYSIFEWLWRLAIDPVMTAQGLMDVSHWQWRASPLVGFASQDVDMLSRGAWRLAGHGHPGLLVVFAAIAVVGLAAGFVLTWELLRSQPPREAGGSCTSSNA